MSVRLSSAGLRSESLFDRIRTERQRRASGGGARRLAQVADLFGDEDRGGVLSHNLRPARLKVRKPR